MQIAILVRKRTLDALAEHSTGELGGAVPINETESLMMVTPDTLLRLLSAARPTDARIDDVLLRLAV